MAEQATWMLHSHLLPKELRGQLEVVNKAHNAVFNANGAMLRMSGKTEPYEFRAMTLKECGTDEEWKEMIGKYNDEKKRKHSTRHITRR